MSGKTWLSNLEAYEKEKTGIKSLKVGYNKVFGYYIEVSKSYINEVPLYYTRKQTLTNGERYITKELKDIEDRLMNAETNALELELQIFENIRQILSNNIEKMQLLCIGLSELDSINSLALAAVKNNYVKPVINNKIKCIKIINGRHPVIDKLIGSNEFIANDTLLDDEENKIIILTGPNMSGKSTYMRQIALITLLAHIGSYVPCDSAEICLTDRIFTRVGASDDLLNSQSTFMVEMLEVSNILNNATEKSLLILDEIGRGTSTCDGLSIAWSTLEYIAHKIKAKTLFATHFYEITELENKIQCVKNYKVLVNELNDKVIFLHKIARGAANKSFGIEVAGLAGVPEEVLERAKSISKYIDKNTKNIDYDEILTKADIAKAYQPNFLDYDNKIKKILKDIDINNCSPMQALVILSDLVKMAKE
jgi:DNA mismatch repair protein MutS